MCVPCRMRMCTHRLAGTAHTRPSSRLGSRTAVALASAVMWERGPYIPPRGDTRRAAVAPLPMRSANRAPITDVSAHGRRQAAFCTQRRTPESQDARFRLEHGRLHGRSRDARKGRRSGTSIPFRAPGTCRALDAQRGRPRALPPAPLAARRAREPAVPLLRRGADRRAVDHRRRPLGARSQVRRERGRTSRRARS